MDMHQEAIGRLGDRLGLPLSFDENEQCMLLLDEDLLVSLYATERGWVLRGMLTKASPDSDTVFWRDLMALNLELVGHFAGSIVFEPESQALLYMDLIAEPDDIDATVEHLERFVNRQEALRERIGNPDASWRP